MFVFLGNQAYGLASRLGTVANPVACFFALFFTRVSTLAISSLVLLGSAASAYSLVLAAQSPTPPLQDETIGEFLCVSMRNTAMFPDNRRLKLSIILFAFLRCFPTSLLSVYFHSSKLLLLCDVVTQEDACHSFGAEWSLRSEVVWAPYLHSWLLMSSSFSKAHLLVPRDLISTLCR